MSKLIQIDYPAEGVMLITLNDAEHMNAFSASMLADLNEAIRSADASGEVRCAVITGAGKAFVAGADIKYMSSLTPQEAITYSKNTTAIYNLIESSSTVFIAAVNGYALGAGLELTLACDIRLSSEYGKFGLPETGLGIIPGGHGTQKLPRIVGSAKAKEMIFLGQTIRAQEARELGIINRICESGNLVDSAVEMAAEIASGASLAIGYAKAAVNASCYMDEKTGYEYEEKLFGLCFSSDEQKEGMQAFTEHRKANFK